MRLGASRLPGWLLPPAILGMLLLVLPLIGVFLRIDWAAVPAIISSPEAMNALRLSLSTAAIATVCCLIIGIPMSILLSRLEGAAAAIMRAAVMLPLVLPPLVGGMALLLMFGRGGLFGDTFDALGFRLPFTTPAVVVAQVFVALPFLIIAVEGALRSADTELESVAEGLGASPWTVLRRVTLPLILPAIASGTILSFTRALGEFGATAMFAGNAPGVTQTVPLAIYTAFNGAGVGQDTALALSLLLILIAVAALVMLRSTPTAGLPR